MVVVVVYIQNWWVGFVIWLVTWFLKDTSKKKIWNNPDSFVILKLFCLNNLIKYLVVFSANLGDLLIFIPSPSSLFNPNSLFWKSYFFKFHSVKIRKRFYKKTQISASLNEPILTLNSWFSACFNLVQLCLRRINNYTSLFSN